MIRPAKAALQLAPKALDGVGMHRATHVLARRVIDGAVRVAFACPTIGLELIGHQGRPLFDVLLNEGAHRVGREVADHAGCYPTFALDGSQDDALSCRPTSALAWANPADIGIVHFHRFGQWIVRLLEQHANLFGNSPRRFVGYAQLPLQLLRRHPIFRVGKQIDRVEPRLERGIRLVKDRIGQGMQLVAAVLTGIALALLHAVEGRAFLTARTPA